MSKRPTHIKRDLHKSNTIYTSIEKQADGQDKSDVHMSKETYTYQKRPTHIKCEQHVN